MNRTVSINDTVLNVGTNPATISRIMAIHLCEKPGMSVGVPCSFASIADMNRVLLTLDNGETAFGYQVELIPHESNPVAFRRFAGWFVERYDLTSFSDRSFVCRVVVSETGYAEGVELSADDGAARISAACLRLRHAYRHRIAPHAEGFNELVQRLSAALAEHRATITQPSMGTTEGVIHLEHA